MTNQNFQSQHTHAAPDESSEGVVANARNLAGVAGERAKVAVMDTASTVTKQARHLLDRQVGKGARIVGDVGSSVKRAAEELDRSAPQLGELAHVLADRIDVYAKGLRASSTDDLLRSASRITREQPALVFGLTALAGFLVLRTLKSAPSSKPPARANYAVDRTGGTDGF